MATTDGVRIGGEYWSKQLATFEALESGDYDLVVFRTGYGGGKTLLGSDWIHSVAVEVPKSDNLVIAPDSMKGGPTTYKRFFDRLPGEETVPDEGGDPENSPIVDQYHAVERRLTYTNGSIARLGSADRWNRYAGGEFNAIYCDEPAHYDTTNLYDLHEMLISRQRTEAGPNVTLWTSTGAGFDQYYDITERMATPDDDPLPWADRMKVIVGSSLDNPFLEEKDKMRAQFAGTERAEQALHGGFAAPEGLVYGDFSRQHHVQSADWIADHVDAGATPIYGYDAGWDHPRVLLQLRPTHHDQWAVTNCYYATEKPFEHLCDPSDDSGWVYERDLERGPLYAEHEPEHIRKFRRAGFEAVKAEKSLDEGIPFVRGKLERKGDAGRPGLVVVDDCVEVVQEFQSYKEEHVGKSGDVPDNCLDSLRYALFTHSPRSDSGEGSGVSYL